jgi:hypothetical protein
MACLSKYLRRVLSSSSAYAILLSRMHTAAVRIASSSFHYIIEALLPPVKQQACK